jgi:hypothetical protein
MAVVTAAGEGVGRGIGGIGAWLGGDLIFGKNNAARVWRGKAFGGRVGETDTVAPRG